jgi:hypothetical protein
MKLTVYPVSLVGKFTIRIEQLAKTIHPVVLPFTFVSTALGEVKFAVTLTFAVDSFSLISAFNVLLKIVDAIAFGGAVIVLCDLFDGREFMRGF